MGCGAALLGDFQKAQPQRKQGNHHTAGNSCQWLKMPNEETMEKLAAKHHVVHGFWSNRQPNTEQQKIFCLDAQFPVSLKQWKGRRGGGGGLRGAGSSYGCWPIYYIPGIGVCMAVFRQHKFYKVRIGVSAWVSGEDTWCAGVAPSLDSGCGTATLLSKSASLRSSTP